jgi:hypothetical protein
MHLHFFQTDFQSHPDAASHNLRSTLGQNRFSVASLHRRWCRCLSVGAILHPTSRRTCVSRRQRNQQRGRRDYNTRLFEGLAGEMLNVFRLSFAFFVTLGRLGVLPHPAMYASHRHPLQSASARVHPLHRRERWTIRILSLARWRMRSQDLPVLHRQASRQPTEACFLVSCTGSPGRSLGRAGALDGLHRANWGM